MNSSTQFDNAASAGKQNDGRMTGLKVRTKVKAGALNDNHNEMQLPA